MASASVSKSDSACNAVSRPDINSAVEVIGGRPMVSSLRVAEHFGKKHYNVIRDIRRVLSKVSEEFARLNFELSEYADETGRKLPMYRMAKDGFTIVVMGYSGDDAMRYKEAYIRKFNSMEQALTEGHHGQPVVIAPSTITPEQCRQLHDIMDAKMSNIPVEQRRGAYAGAWTRFNRHFRIAKYDQLPAEKFSEAINYLIGMGLRQKALPAQEMLPVTQAEPRALRLIKVRERINGEISVFLDKMAVHYTEVRDILGSTIWAGNIHKSPLNAARWEAYRATSDAAQTLGTQAHIVDQSLGALAYLERAAEDMEAARKP